MVDAQDRQDVRILAVSRDTPDESRQLVRELTGGADEPPFPFLADRDLAVIRRYGLLNPESGALPHPATFIIDKSGVVRWRFVEVDYRKRASNQQILRELDTL